MAIVCPTVMPSSDNLHIFRTMMDRVGELSDRLQIDLMDGDFAPNRNVDPASVWWPEGKKADVHLMYKHPSEQVDKLIALNPNMIILHAESEVDILHEFDKIKGAGIKTGLAILRPTNVDDVSHLIQAADHVLLFAGELGHFGEADLGILDKVSQARAIKPLIEIGWDGGANQTNISQLAYGGIDVINVGGALQRADHPEVTYQELLALAK